MKFHSNFHSDQNDNWTKCLCFFFFPLNRFLRALKRYFKLYFTLTLIQTFSIFLYISHSIAYVHCTYKKKKKKNGSKFNWPTKMRHDDDEHKWFSFQCTRKGFTRYRFLSFVSAEKLFYKTLRCPYRKRIYTRMALNLF